MDKIREKIVKQELMSYRVYKVAVFFTFFAVPANAYLVVMILLLFLKGIDSLTFKDIMLNYALPLMWDLICIALWIIYKRLSKSIEHLKCKLRTLWYAGVKE